MAETEGVDKTVTKQNEKNYVNTCRGGRPLSLRGVGGVEDLDSNYRPIKGGEHGDVFLESQGWSLPAFDAPAPHPAKAVRPANYKGVGWGVVSGRSRRELKQILAAPLEGAGVKVFSNIQINENGHYFVYAEIEPTVAAASVDDCVEPKVQKIEDLTMPEDDCDDPVEQKLEDLVIPENDCEVPTENTLDEKL